MGFAPMITAGWLGAGYAGKRKAIDQPARERAAEDRREELRRRNRKVQEEVALRTAAYRRQQGQVTTAGQGLVKGTPATQRETLG